jgi:hypothetical protein
MSDRIRVEQLIEALRKAKVIEDFQSEHEHRCTVGAGGSHTYAAGPRRYPHRPGGTRQAEGQAGMMWLDLPGKVLHSDQRQLEFTDDPPRAPGGQEDPPLG